MLSTTAAESDRATRADRDGVFHALFVEHYSYVWTSLRRLGVPDRDRDDLVNELFVRVYAKLDTLDGERSPRPWLFAFAVRMASDYRKLARHRVVPLESETDANPPSPFPRPDEAADQSERRRLVLAALAELDLDKRAVVVLHDLDETPIPDVARALQIPEGTAYSRLRAGRIELTAALRRRMSDPSPTTADVSSRRPA